MNAVPVVSLARFVTRCGCTREMVMSPPFAKTYVIPLFGATEHAAIVLDDVALLGMFEDEVERRSFTLQGIESTTPGRIVAVYHERKEPRARRT
jgi:hypothetical protein